MLVKICGITRLEDAVLAAELGATAIGFVFWRSSPRFVDPIEAQRVARALPVRVMSVGVFVNQPGEQSSWNSAVIEATDQKCNRVADESLTRL